MKIPFFSEYAEKIRTLKDALMHCVYASQMLQRKMERAIKEGKAPCCGHFPKAANFDFAGLKRAYGLLSDDYSKKIFAGCVAARASGNEDMFKSLMPVPFGAFKRMLSEVNHKFKYGDDTYEISANNWKMQYAVFNIPLYGEDLRLVTTANAVNLCIPDFIEQYRYRDKVFIESGDYVLDGGGCLGDTMLCFAAQAGKNGRVFTFEFNPYELEIAAKNMEMNPTLSERCRIFKNALWNKSDESLYVCDNGHGTWCSMSEFSGYSYRVPTKSIDDLVREMSLPHLDFIKLDIEGAEMECLRGGADSIRKFHPKLAVSLYHKDSDFWEIPNYIEMLAPRCNNVNEGGYRFYVKHNYWNMWETVMYAVYDPREIL